MCWVTSRVWLSLICLLGLLSTRIKADLTCRFGPGCYYECHCEEDENGAYVPCDVDTGACPGACQDGNPETDMIMVAGGTEPYFEGAWSGTACQTGNVAYNKTASHVGTRYDGVASRSVDGILGRQSRECTMTITSEEDLAWWEVDLHENHVIYGVSLISKATHTDKLCDTNVHVLDADQGSMWCGITAPDCWIDEIINITCQNGPLVGRYVNLKRLSWANKTPNELGVCEVFVTGYLKKECPGYYGSFCNTTCNCLEPCDPVTGQCSAGCAAGWRGDECQDACLAASWGPSCMEQCNCEDPDELCNITTGACASGCAGDLVGTGCNIGRPHTNGSLELTYITEAQSMDVPLWLTDTPTLDHGWSVMVRADSTFDVEPPSHYLFQYLTSDGTWITLQETNETDGAFTYIDDGHFQYYVENTLRLVPVLTEDGETYVGTTEIELVVTPECPDLLWGLNCLESCNCGIEEVCNFTNGACNSSCADNYVGTGCNAELPVLTGVPQSTQLATSSGSSFVMEFTPWAEEDVGEEPAHYVLQIKADADTWQDFQLSAHLLMNLISSDVWENIQEVPAETNGTFIYVDNGHLRYNVVNELRIAPVLIIENRTYYGTAENLELIPECPEGTYWGETCKLCRCADATEQCNSITGACSSGCAENYVGTGCDGELPQLTGVPEFTYQSTDTWLVTFSPWTDSDVGDEPSHYILQILDDTGAWLDIMQISHDGLTGGSFIYTDDGYLEFDATNELRILPVLHHDGQDYPGTAVLLELTINGDPNAAWTGTGTAQNQGGTQSPVFISNGTKFVIVVAVLMLILHMIVAAIEIYHRCTGKHRSWKDPVEDMHASNTKGAQEPHR